LGQMMIERLAVEELVGFERAELSFGEGLIVFTGPSGAGKSVLMGAILALFGLSVPQARLSEIDLVGDFGVEKYGYEPDEPLTIKAIKKEKSRYFLAGQSISKKVLQKIFAPHVHYLHQRDNAFFEARNLLELLDGSIAKREFLEAREAYRKAYGRWRSLREELEELLRMEQKNEELKEFLAFEISRIERIDPKPGEYEELLALKKELSRREKRLEAIARAEGIFEYEGAVAEALTLLERDGSFFEGAMAELREIFESERARLEELGEMDVEGVLERIEALSSLKRRYGSVEEALEALRQKREELKRLENLAFEKERLQKEVEEAKRETERLAEVLTHYRREGAQRLQERINRYLPSLKMPKASFVLETKEPGPEGADLVKISLDGVPLEKISSGEYNRLRLAVMAASGTGRGILILDEIDANISGEESMAVAKILKELARSHQIFAISHQAQLASSADHHFLVAKEGGKSVVRPIEGEDRVAEIARIISGEEITSEAKEFAKKMLKEKRC